MSKKYKTIVIDPPWNVGKSIRGKSGFTPAKSKRAKTPYVMLKDSEIKNLDIVINMSNDDCALWMWTTHPKLPVALEIIQAWGFKYKHCMTWHKLSGHNGHVPITAMGHLGFKRNSELVIYATKGRSIIDMHKLMPFVLSAKMRRHSEKPSEFYELIRGSFPAPRIDIFARRRHPGFDAWGNQVEKEIQTCLTF